MRVELYGCRYKGEFKSKKTFKCLYRKFLSYISTSFPINFSERFYDQVLGIQSGKIKNAAMTASSQWDKYHAPFRARLHVPRQGRYIGSWSARHNNHNQWLKIFLGRTYRVTGIATQGRQDADQWVTAYYVYYSQDGVHMSRVTYWWDYIRVSSSCFDILLLTYMKKNF